MAFVGSALAIILSLIVSKCVSGMNAKSWYHEIVLCGVDKLSMSITSLSNEEGERKPWMKPFEGYFGFTIKFINPACLLFMLFGTAAEDLAEPYGSSIYELHMVCTLFMLIPALLLITPMFMCAYPEQFEHNVDLEFKADNEYAMTLRGMTDKQKIAKVRKAAQAERKGQMDNAKKSSQVAVTDVEMSATNG